MEYQIPPFKGNVERNLECFGGYMEKVKRTIKETIYAILTSKKGLLGLVGLVILVSYAFYIRAGFAEFSFAIIGILTAMGLGFQQDKKLEAKNGNDNIQTKQ